MAAAAVASPSPILQGAGQPFSLQHPQAARGKSSHSWSLPPGSSCSSCLSPPAFSLPALQPSPTQGQSLPISRYSSNSPLNTSSWWSITQGTRSTRTDSPSLPAFLGERSLCLCHQHFSFLGKREGPCLPLQPASTAQEPLGRALKPGKPQCTHGMATSCTLLMICFPTMMTSSSCASSAKHPPGLHCGEKGVLSLLGPAHRDGRTLSTGRHPCSTHRLGWQARCLFCPAPTSSLRTPRKLR